VGTNEVGGTNRASGERALENIRTQLLRSRVRSKTYLKEQIEEAQDRTRQILNDLQRVADAYADLLQSISSMFAQELNRTMTLEEERVPDVE
jgi:archaellum component FlaC